MKKILYLALFVHCLNQSVYAQNLGFKASSSLKFLNGNNDTIPYPFTGGFIAPQFNSIDIDQDGKKDLMVFDRGGNIVHPYINKGTTGQVKYEYAPQFRNKFPVLLNWVRLYDYNNDGKEDIITNADPNAPHPPDIFVQNNHVRVFKNISSGGELKFQLISHQLKAVYYFTDTTPLPVSLTDLPDVGDIDQDGDMDLIAMNIFGSFIELAKNYQVEMSLPPDSFFFHIVDRCWGSVKITNDVTLATSCSKTYFKTDAHNGTTLTLFDNDGDGDLDLYTGDVLNEFIFYIKNGRKETNAKYNGFATDSMIAFDSIFPSGTLRAKFPSTLAAYFVDVNNDGKKDVVIAPNIYSGAKTHDQIWLYLNTGTASLAAWTFVKKNFLQDETVDIGRRFAPAQLDYDQDGDMDLIAGSNGDWQYTQGSKDQLMLFKNVGSKTYPVYKMIDSNYLNILSQQLIDIRPATGDLDGDSMPDILLGDYGGTLTYLHNTTASPSGNMSFAPAVKNFKNIQVNGASSPAIVDLNYDGKGDILMGTDLGFIHYYRNIDTLGRIGLEFSSMPVADTLGKILSKEKTGQFFGHASPFAYQAGKDSMIELMVGSLRGRIRSYRVDAALEKPFAEIDSILMVPGDTFYSNAFMGFTDEVSRAPQCIPLVANFDDDSIPDMLVGMKNGGLLYFKGYFRSNLPPIIGHDTVSIPRLKEDTSGTGIKPIVTFGLMVFPNPANSTLHLKRVDGHEQEIDILIHDILGRKVFEAKLLPGMQELIIDISATEAGFLFLLPSSGTSSGSVIKIAKY